MRDSGFSGERKYKESGGFYSSPREYLLKGNFPELQSHDLVRPTDFFSYGKSEASKIFGQWNDVCGKRIGSATIDRVQYVLGSQFGRNKGRFRVHKIDEDIAGIVSVDERGNDEALTHTFSLVDPDDTRVYVGKDSKAQRKFGKRSGLEIFPYEEQGDNLFLEKREGETEEEFQNRAAANSFSELIKAKQELVQKTGVSLEGLSPREQGEFLQFFMGADEDTKEELYWFVSIFQKRGLRIFLALQYDIGAAKKILNINRKFEIPEAAVIFEKYSDIVGLAENVDIELESFFEMPEKAQELDKPRVTEEIMKRAGRILTEYSKKGQTKDRKIADFVKELDEIKEDIITFASIFKSAYRGQKDLSFEDVRGLELESTDDVSAYRIEMEDIIKRNYEGSPLLGGVLKGFQSAMENPDNTFYILKKDDKVISFDRFEEKNGQDQYGRTLVEFASFNTDPHLQQSSIGTAMMRETLDRQAKNHTIVADTDPTSPICPYYVQKAGFVITGAQEYKGTGHYVFSIERDDRAEYDVLRANIDLGSLEEAAERAMDYMSVNPGTVFSGYYKKGDRYYGELAVKKDEIQGEAD
ncbi:MAG: hypothetical protein ABII02_02660 [Candidatus Magasanikbacteria bacterium]